MGSCHILKACHLVKFPNCLVGLDLPAAFFARTHSWFGLGGLSGWKQGGDRLRCGSVCLREYRILYHTMLACVRHQRRHLATIDTYTGNQIAHKIIFLFKHPGDRLSIACKESLPRRDRNRSLNDFEWQRDIWGGRIKCMRAGRCSQRGMGGRDHQ